MQRRFNYTGRKKINRSAIRLTLLPRNDGPQAFDAKIDLGGLDLPEHANVYVEAYHKASYMRFQFGRVGEIAAPEDRVLRDIDGGASALFRVKVVDESGEHGQILAEVDGLSPLNGDDAAANRLSLLPVVTEDLRQAVWRLNFSNDRPVLVLNRDIENIALIAHGDEHFFSLVYPAVVQRILIEIFQDGDAHDVDGDPDDWHCQWLKFVCQLPGVTEPPKRGEDDDESLRERQMIWIEKAAVGFCERYQVRDRYVRAHRPKE
jgi:hypothetical protein